MQREHVAGESGMWEADPWGSLLAVELGRGRWACPRLRDAPCPPALIPASSARTTLGRAGARGLLNNNVESGVNIRGEEIYLPRDLIVICFLV